ncbi:MAG: hypothetical protein WA962_02200 [Ornithinimicrobium sp.]
MAEAHRWRFVDPSGAVLTDLGLAEVAFPSQSEAEAWLGEEWPLLAEAGVGSVTLLRGDEVVYGPMSLSP